jgi:hypothetical protein
MNPHTTNQSMSLPAPGVMTTRPVIMPWTAPITDGFPNTNTSKPVHTNKLVAAQMFVLMTARDAIRLEATAAPPLNPAHPIHSNPAPASISKTLLGGNLSRSFVNLGPTYKTPPKTNIHDKPARIANHLCSLLLFQEMVH